MAGEILRFLFGSGLAMLWHLAVWIGLFAGVALPLGILFEQALPRPRAREGSPETLHCATVTTGYFVLITLANASLAVHSLGWSWTIALMAGVLAATPAGVLVMCIVRWVGRRGGYARATLAVLVCTLLMALNFGALSLVRFSNSEGPATADGAEPRTASPD